MSVNLAAIADKPWPYVRGYLTRELGLGDRLDGASDSFAIGYLSQAIRMDVKAIAKEGKKPNCTPGKTIQCGKACRQPQNCKQTSQESVSTKTKKGNGSVKEKKITEGEPKAVPQKPVSTKTDATGSHKDLPVAKMMSVWKAGEKYNINVNGNIKEISQKEFDRIVTTEFNGDRAAARGGKIANQAEIVAAMSKNAGLSSEEALSSLDAIRAFTSVAYGGIRNFERGISTDKKYGDLSRRINQYVEKAPKFKGKVYRGLQFWSVSERDKFLQDIANGYELEAVSSFSSSKAIANEFAGADEKNAAGIVFVVNNKSGVSIKNISQERSEDEVIVPKGSKYRVTGKPKKSGKTMVVTLEEF